MTKSSAPLTKTRKKAPVHPTRQIPQKLVGEKSTEELDDAVKETNNLFFSKMAKGAKKPMEQKHFHLPPAELRRMVDDVQKKRRESRKPSPLSDYDRTLSKEYKKMVKARKGVAQLGEQELQSHSPLVIGNEYGSNIDLLQIPQDDGPVDLVQLCNFYATTCGVDIADMVFATAPVVSSWEKYEHGRSLWDPEKLNDLGTQMYALNNWYLDACAREESAISIRVRDEHWFRGNDVMYLEFSELHQLCHLYSLDKTIISCYCL
jgi:hypothetical protein